MPREIEPVDVLLVEPNPEEADRVTNVLEKGDIENRVHVVTDGTTALDFLLQRGEYADASRPALIFLEFALPDVSGADVLEAILADDDFKQIPVIVLMETGRDEDITQAYESHANAVVEKPIDTAQFVETIRDIEDFWVRINRPPPEREDREKDEKGL